MLRNSFTRRSNLTIALAAMLALTILLPAAPAQTASVRVVHGIPGQDVSPAVDPALPVDILVADSVCLLSGFTFGDIAGPFTIPAGTYNVKISLANTLTPCSGDAVISADVPIAAAENVSIVAHLTAAGAPTASKFVNDVSTPAEGGSRLIAHHVANAPVVDILVPGGFPPTPLLWVPAVGNTPNMNQAAGDLPGRQVLISILPAGTRTPVFNRIINLVPGLTYTAYAVGSLTNGTFTVIVEPIGGLRNLTIRL
jgi:hypothetical protein